MGGLIFGDDYYFDKILESSKKVKDEGLKEIANQIENLAVIALLTSNEYSISGDTIFYQKNGKEYTFSLDEITSTYKSLANKIVSNGKVSIEDAKAAVTAKEEELTKVNEELIQQSDKFKKDSETDALTGMHNRRRFDEDCKSIDVKNTVIVMADINYLKKINDNDGHESGDILIKNVANEMNKMFPDRVYRVGGDEFYIIVDKISEVDLKDKIEEIKDNLNENSLIPKDSVAFGYCFWSPENNDLKSILLTAERRMYKEKQKIKTENSEVTSNVAAAIAINNNFSSDMVYNIHAFEFNGRSYRCLVAPLYIDADMLRPEIFCFMKNDIGTSGGFVSDKDSSIIKFMFDNECFLLQGRIIDGKFVSSLITSGDTLRAGFNIENMQTISESPESIFNTKGHAVSVKNEIVVHAIPLSNKNNENGICQSVICVEDGEIRAVFKNNPNKETKYKDVTILAHWNDNEYEMEAL